MRDLRAGLPTALDGSGAPRASPDNPWRRWIALDGFGKAGQSEVHRDRDRGEAREALLVGPR
eukprot:15445421-Alexandrium_andersonii.AAC.1